MERPTNLLRVTAALVAALAGLPALAMEPIGHDTPSVPDAWRVVPEDELANMRGGIDFGVLVANFAIERLVRVNGEVVARTQLAFNGLGNLGAGLAPSVEVLGNLANLIQVGQSNGSDGGGTLTAADMAQFAQSMAGGAQANRSSSSIAAASVSGQAGPGPSTGSTAALDALPGIAGAAGAPLAGANGGTNAGGVVAPGARGAPVGGAGAGPLASAGRGVGSAGALPSLQTSPVSAPTASLPGSTPASGIGSPAAPAAGSGASSASIALMNPPMSIPVGNTGQVIVVNGIPNAAALATSIQNSVEATRIETMTSINATLSSLAALRSSNFTETMRQQAIDSIRR
jgi:hypothetical protein